MKKQQQKVVILGCGNVAWHIASHLKNLGDFQVLVYNHQANPLLSEFRLKLKCPIQVGFKEIVADADFYFICVSDDHIAEAATALNPKKPDAFVLHTSGSASIKTLGDGIYNSGVFYPLQSFSRSDKVDWQKVPVILETGNKKSAPYLKEIAKRFTPRVEIKNSADRLQLHLAAVMVNNFTNSLYAAAAEILQNHPSDFDLLHPLIFKTGEKIKTLSPIKAQTGPAKRGDAKVMKKHLKLLAQYNDIRKVYKQMSRLIARQQKQHHEL